MSHPAFSPLQQQPVAALISDVEDRLRQVVRPAVSVAVLVPCFNEELTIAAVVESFRAALPYAAIYVYDNNSSDATAARAGAAGAVVRAERRQGKGHVIRRMFADIDADVYVLVDGDGTYDAAASPAIVDEIVAGGLDFVNVARQPGSQETYRAGHRFGNWALTQIVRSIFGRETSDMLSGYKGLSRRFVKSFPAMSNGFETETELTVHALELRMPMGELSGSYKERPSGSASKLRTFRDGWQILMLISRLVKDERPLRVFGHCGLLTVVAGVLFGLPVIKTYLETGLVPRLPTAVLSVGLVMLGCLCVFTGINLDMVSKMRLEMKRLAYLSVPRRGA